ncbi:protein of unknown function [Hyphomicrobium sp. MC1]|nr:protein of unknown function [Hyphomicrobium sp. MC1]
MAVLHRGTNVGENGINNATRLLLRQLAISGNGINQIFLAHLVFPLMWEVGLRRVGSKPEAAISGSSGPRMKG